MLAIGNINFIINEFFSGISSIEPLEICEEIKKNIELLDKSRLILINCAQMLKDYDKKNFLSDED